MLAERPPFDPAASRSLARRIRIHSLRMTTAAQSSHIASALSIADIVAVLYQGVLRIKPDDPAWNARDRFIISKGHAGVAIYAVLAESGFFPIESLGRYCQDGSPLVGHLAHRGVPGVELSTGSLGHGLSVGAGMAYGAMLDARQHRVFVLLSDGECDEGSTWEAILFAGHHHLEKLVAIIDYNRLQSLGSVAATLELEPFAEKWRAFGWTAVEVDGHDHDAIYRALSNAASTSRQPLVVLANTTKGKGVSFMEDSVLWHYRSAQGQEFVRALAELEAS
ncbi:MAG: transketolase [Gemmatimonadales bacterium]